MPTGDDEEEIEYGKLYVFTPESESKEVADSLQQRTPGDIWPNWSEGVPTKLRRKVGSPAFFKDGVSYEYREYYETVELEWNLSRKLFVLRDNYNLLPSHKHRSQWSGVYRIFCPETTIDRFCGKDPTGTLYLGRAGNGGRNWSILRTRLMAIANKEHHATSHWFGFPNHVQEKFPWNSLAVEWAFTGQRMDHKGEPQHAAILAETWLLASYNDSYGEYPPLNQKG
ncbi:MAG: hypothetical protein J0I29_04525 [Rhizobiales bacterium]|nr:hypothetical protein [Hyphomicrobiales bacterium]